jgi:hypothetical protein
LAAPKTLLLGYGTTGLVQGFTTGSLLDPTNLDEFDVVIWETSLLDTDAPRGQSQGWAPTNEVGTRFVGALKAKAGELQAWATAGHTLVVVLDKPLYVFEYGTPNNPHIRNSFDTATLSLLAAAALNRKAGSKVKIAERNSKRLLADWAGKIQYHYLIGSENRQDILVVETALSAAPQAVASIVPTGNGQIIFVPTVSNGKEREAYLSSLSALHDQLSRARPPLPQWVEAFGSGDERAIKGEIAERQDKIAELESAIALSRDQLEKLGWIKVLVAGTGDEFMNEAKRALEILGFQVARVDGSRTDLIAKDESRILACETKGVERAGKEEDLRQTKTWVAEVSLAIVAEDEVLARDPHIRQCAMALSELGIAASEQAGLNYNVRGLLVLATFRNVPLDTRTIPDFSGDMLLNAARSEVCVLSGHQLANLVLLCEKYPDRKAEVRASIFATAGAYHMHDFPDLFQRISG